LCADHAAAHRSRLAQSGQSNRARVCPLSDKSGQNLDFGPRWPAFMALTCRWRSRPHENRRDLSARKTKRAAVPADVMNKSLQAGVADNVQIGTGSAQSRGWRPLPALVQDEIDDIHRPRAYIGSRLSRKGRDAGYWHLTDKRTEVPNGRYWTNNGQRSARRLKSYAAIDPKRTLGIGRGTV
jgi:hypothetical protein